MSDAVLTAPSEQAPPALDLRAKIDRLEALMRSEPQVEIEPVHYFAHGLYAREITIKAGTLLTGKVHRTEHLNIVSKGRIAVSISVERRSAGHVPHSFERTVTTSLGGTDSTTRETWTMGPR